MSRAIASLIPVLVLLVAPVSSFAEEPYPAGSGQVQRPSPVGGLTWTFGGGAAVPAVGPARRLPVGGQFGVTIGYRLFDQLLVQAEYSYTAFGFTTQTRNTVHSGNLNLVLSLLPRTEPVEIYMLAGPGIYGRSGPLEPGTGIEFGFDAGIGASVSLGEPVRFFIEARLQYIRETIDNLDGPQQMHDLYFPVSVGFRYF